MPRRKKKKKRLQASKPKIKKTEIFNPVIKDSGLIKKKVEQKDTNSEKQAPPKPPKKMDDDEYFLQKMSDVQPLEGASKKITPLPNINKRPIHPAPDDELDTLTHLHDLVSGTAEMDITFSDEYIEGAIQGFSPKLMQRLKKGQFPIQDYVDLHGLTKKEAQVRVTDFLLNSYRMGIRCVLVVHGRGLNSANNIPVLKEQLPIWLKRGAIRKIVLAFSTAKPYDGGTGALYILLRKRSGVI
jgi:DNA-nicking Smr family endonuclease